MFRTCSLDRVVRGCRKRGGTTWAERKLGHSWFGRGSVCWTLSFPSGGTLPLDIVWLCSTSPLGLCLEGSLLGRLVGPQRPPPSHPCSVSLAGLCRLTNCACSLLTVLIVQWDVSFLRAEVFFFQRFIYLLN